MTKCLRSFLSWNVGLQLAGLLVLSAVWTWHDFGEARRDTMRQAETLAELLEQDAVRSLTVVNLALEEVGGLVGELGLPALQTESGWKRLHALANLLPRTGAIFVYDPRGQLRAESPQFPPHDFNAAQREYFQALATGTNAYYIGKALRGRTVHQFFFPVARAIRDSAGRLVAVAQVGVAADQIGDRFGDLRTQGHTCAIYSTRDGAMVVRYPLAAEHLTESVRSAPFFAPLATGKAETWSGWTVLDGSKQFVAARTVKALPLILTTSVGEPEALAGAWRRCWWRSAAVLAFMGILVSLTLIRRRGERRLALADAARERVEELNRQTLEALPAHIAVLDASGQIVTTNRAWTEFAGHNDACGSAVLAGVNYLEVCRRAAAAADADAQQALVGVEAVLGGRSTQFSMEYACHGPHEQRWFSMVVVPFAAGGTRGAVVTHLNITERKRAEEALRKNEELLRTLVQSVPDLVWVKDTAGRITLGNQATFALLGGGDPQKVLGRGTHELVADPQQAQPIEANDQQVMRTQTPGVVVEEFGPPGHTVIFQTNKAPLRDAAGKLIGVVGVSRDITAMRRAEEQLRASEQQLRDVLDNLFAFVAVLTPDGTVLEANRAPLEMAGLRREDVIGRKFWDCSWWDHDPQVQAQLRAACERAAAGQFSRYDVEVRMANGELVPIDFALSPLRDAAGRVTRLIPSAVVITERKHAEERLRRNAETFHGLVTNHPMGIYVVDADFRLYSASRGARRAFANVPSPLIGRDLGECLRFIWPEPFAGEAIARFRHTLATGEPYVATTAEHRRDLDGIEVYDWRLERVTLPDGRPGVVCYFYDLTERQRLESALRASEERMQQALQVSHSYTFEWFLATDAVRRSDSCAKILDLSGREAIEDTGQRYFQRIHPDDRERFTRLLQALTPQADAYNTEYRIVRGDGAVAVLEETGRATFDAANHMVQVLGITTDITARKQAETELEGHRQLLEAVFEHMPAAINIIRGHDLRVLMVNPGYRAIAVGKTEMVGKTLNEIWPETGRDFLGLCRRVLQSGEPYEAIDDPITIQRQPGGPLELAWFTWGLYRIPLSADQGWGIFNPAWETTARKQTEERIRELNATLEQRVRARTAELEASNRELEAFCYSVSHDLRSPLRAIAGFAHALQVDCGPQLSAQGQDYLARVVAGAQRMGHLIDHLLGLSRLTRAEMHRQPVDLTGLAREICRELQASAPARRVEFRIAPGLVVNGDEHLLQAAIRNLLENAWKFTSNKADARIEMGVLTEKHAAQSPHQPTAPDPSRPVFYVRDNGAGFDMKYAAKLFTPFQRLHSPREFPGTGIGLAAVARAILRHGGRVWAEAAVDQGATLYFTIAEETNYAAPRTSTAD